ncbi:Non-repetitive/WGA-negative nucleoporin C-terminal-domain-containing protein [Calycina marina]|uniref:Non-repetitive/WGA-negative nucleoporin C-terminal-domain-containing protein n=1 Tax=Calycina marina TaxID=1763456 RepID=A0A9P7YWT5_9HELO|nr:Non-repetitive/WGA-negative nucleoporin C-terminal-domain-containing protein [Calycina marina]
MFSQSPAVHRQPTPAVAGSVRSSRRRQRPLSNEGSVQLPKAKRQRSALSDVTFLPPNDALEMEEVKKASAPKRQTSSQQQPVREIVVRSRSTRLGDRVEKDDGITILTKNDTFTVSKLLAYPDRLQGDTSRQQGAIYSESGYAITLSHTHALVWPYTEPKRSPATLSFKLPYPSKHATDPLPLGALVSASTSNDYPGLVVVMPSGKITFWESIHNAATLDLITTQKNGVELTIPGLHKGELVIQVLNAESAGFVLAFDSGRTAYMSVRDGQGRPAISVQFIRNNSLVKAGGGIFGSIRQYVISGASEEIAAVRAGPSDNIGERDVVIATVNGRISSWKIHRGGHTALYAEAEGREVIVMAMKEKQFLLSELSLETFELVDFTHTPKPPTGSHYGDHLDGDYLLLLVSLGRGTKIHYALINIVLQPAVQSLVVTDIRSIKSYTSPINRQALSKPKLYLPNPALVAYVVFDKAVVVFSMVKRPDSPDSQLRSESHLPEAFEDVIDFRGDSNFEIVGSGPEEPQVGGLEGSKRPKLKYPATVLLIRGVGVIRIAITDMTKHQIAGIPRKVTARSKLEQAVVYGVIEHNPINFAVRDELQFPPEEIAAAAVELSHDILKGKVTPITSNAPAAIKLNIQKRAAALHHLAEFLKASGVRLDRVTKWNLLCGAERMEAASTIWRLHDSSLASKPKGQKHGLLAEVVESIHEKSKTEPVSEDGEIDRVRHWFIHDIWNMEIAIPWAFQAARNIFRDAHESPNHIMTILSEADDMVIGGLEAALSFRTENLELYGLEAENLKFGVLQGNFEGLPEFWTSTRFIVANVRKQASLSEAVYQEYATEDLSGSNSTRSLIDSASLAKLRFETPKLIDLAIRCNHERIMWLFAQGDVNSQNEATSIVEAQKTAEHDQLILLANFMDMPDDAMELAEKHAIMESLAVVLKTELFKCTQRIEHPDSLEDKADAEEHLEILRGHARRHFSRYGEDWANAFYGCQIRVGDMDNLLNDHLDSKTLPYLSKFLRSSPTYAKIAWIHEVSREHSYREAAKTLLQIASHEKHLWSKKVELGIGKITRMAAYEVQQVAFPDHEGTDLGNVKKDLGLVKIQQKLHSYVLPSTLGAIDENAEVQLALEVHGNPQLKKRKTQASLLDQGMTYLVKQESLGVMTLVDVLTLIDSNDRAAEKGSLKDEQFYLALKALKLGSEDKNEQMLIQRVIWRRCILKDDWKHVNMTESKDDAQVQCQLRATALYTTFKACFRYRIFENDSPIKFLFLQDIVGACTTELDHRFDRFDNNNRELLMRDMQSEDAALYPFIEHSQLNHWYNAAQDLAKDDLMSEYERVTKEGSEMKEIELELIAIEQIIKEDGMEEANDALMNGHMPHRKAGLKVKGTSRVSSRADNY